MTAQGIVKRQVLFAVGAIHESPLPVVSWDGGNTSGFARPSLTIPGDCPKRSRTCFTGWPHKSANSCTPDRYSHPTVTLKVGELQKGLFLTFVPKQNSGEKSTCPLRTNSQEKDMPNIAQSHESALQHDSCSSRETKGEHQGASQTDVSSPL